MPTYQYACTSCGHELEAVQSFTDPALTECPACRGALRKVFSAVGVVFKGSGFYKTDSRASSTKGSTSSAGDGGSTTSGDAPSSPTSSPPAAPASTPTTSTTSSTTSST